MAFTPSGDWLHLQKGKTNSACRVWESVRLYILLNFVFHIIFFKEKEKLLLCQWLKNWAGESDKIGFKSGLYTTHYPRPRESYFILQRLISLICKRRGEKLPISGVLAGLNVIKQVKLLVYYLAFSTYIVKAMVFPVVMYGCESWTIKKVSAKKLMLLNCGVGEDSWESLGLQGDQTSPS